jgi:hypothetical protein
MGTDRGKVFEVLLTRLNIGDRSAALGALIERYVDGFIDLGWRRTKGGRMAGRPARALMPLGRLLVFVLAPKGRGLACHGPFQFFDSILEFTILLAKLVNQLRLSMDLRPKGGVLGLEFPKALLASIGLHAVLPTPQCHLVSSEVCAINGERANKKVLQKIS